MSLTVITPQEASQLIAKGAKLVDVRNRDERARIAIPGAVPHPLLELAPGQFKDQPVIFHCRTGNRTSTHAAQLAAAAIQPAYVLEGGLDAWKQAGLPVKEDRKQPIEIMRQVQIGAGSLVLAGVVLGALVNPVFYGLSAFVGAGLVFAGVSGFCGIPTETKWIGSGRNCSSPLES
jgi:rhodanese-related sulfurtransferase